jgi:hypothetical protein
MFHDEFLRVIFSQSVLSISENAKVGDGEEEKEVVREGSVYEMCLNHLKRGCSSINRGEGYPFE